MVRYERRKCPLRLQKRAEPLTAAPAVFSREVALRNAMMTTNAVRGSVFAPRRTARGSHTKLLTSIEGVNKAALKVVEALELCKASLSSQLLRRGSARESDGAIYRDPNQPNALPRFPGPPLGRRWCLGSVKCKRWGCLQSGGSGTVSTERIVRSYQTLPSRAIAYATGAGGRSQDAYIACFVQGQPQT